MADGELTLIDSLKSAYDEACSRVPQHQQELLSLFTTSYQLSSAFFGPLNDPGGHLESACTAGMAWRKEFWLTKQRT